MNYKVILSWLVAGFFAYNAGIHANKGTEIFSAIIAVILFLIGLKYLSFKDEKSQWEKDQEEAEQISAVWPQDTSVLSPKPKKKIPKPTAKTRIRRVYRLKVGDRVKIMSVEKKENRGLIGKTGHIEETRQGGFYHQKVLGAWALVRKTRVRGGRQLGQKFPNGYKKKNS